MGKNYHKRRHYHTSAKGAQEAHEAIRPTYIDNEEAGKTAQEKKLYNLIWKRTIACQMADAELEKTTVLINVEGRSEQFVAQGEVVKFDGFLKVYRESLDNENDEQTESGLLPAMTEGQVLMRSEIVAQQRFTQAPLRYTEASLVHKLEELGIGRPSTYAPTISTIQQREYVMKGDKEGVQRMLHTLILKKDTIKQCEKKEMAGNEKGKLLPTDVGLVVNDFLLENFPEILDYNFTANVEKDFDAVAEGKEDWTKLMRSFYDGFEPQIERALDIKSERKVGERALGVDPATGSPVSVKIGRFGPMVQLGETSTENKPRFATLKRGQSIETITLEEALELFRLPRDLGQYEDKKVVANIGRFGPYVQHAGKFVSIPKGEDPLEITLERAIELVEAKGESDAASHIKNFAPEEPEMEILNGRFGPYIKYKGANYKLPKDLHPRAAELTLEECRKVVEEQPKKPAKKKK